jgi:hypothetical protein
MSGVTNDGNEISQRARSCRHGADPFKNVSERKT